MLIPKKKARFVSIAHNLMNNMREDLESLQRTENDNQIICWCVQIVDRFSKVLNKPQNFDTPAEYILNHLSETLRIQPSLMVLYSVPGCTFY